MKLPCSAEIKKSPFPATAAGFGEGTPQQVSDRGKMSVIRNLVPWSILALNKCETDINVNITSRHD